MTVAQLKESTNLKLWTDLYDKVITASLVTDMVSDQMTNNMAGSIWVTDKNDNEDLITDAKNLKIAAIILAEITLEEGQPVSDDILEEANTEQITIFSSPFTAPNLVGELDALGIRIDPYGQAESQKPDLGSDTFIPTSGKKKSKNR